MFDVIVIGAGLSGLSSAVELSNLGYRVLLLEQRNFCGGRTYSFIDKNTGEFIDNGQHLMLGCYQATRRYLRLIGTEKLTSLQKSLRLNFIDQNGNTSFFECPKLPSPFHLAGGLLRFSSLSFKDRIEMLKVSKELLCTSPSKEIELDRITADKWLQDLHQSNNGRKYLWDILTVGALNNYPRNVSALMLFRVLRAAFLGRRTNSSLLIPNVELSKLFVDPAVRFITSHGGEVRPGVNVKNFVIEGTCITSVRDADGKEYYGRSFISAIPWHAARTVLPLHNISFNLFYSSPIISIYFWLDRTITDLEFAALPGMRVQWLFNRTKLLEPITPKKAEVNAQCLSLVISGAQDYIDLDKEELLKIAFRDLQCVLPQVLDVKIISSLVVKEKRATFIPSTGLEKLRPDTKTAYNNLFLAGDWTATGYPATIEGAVISGRNAAELIQKIVD